MNVTLQRQGKKMRKRKLISSALVALVGVALAGDAFAKPRYRISGGPERGSVRGMPGYGAPGPFDPRGQSWLEPGTKVPVGSENRYMVHQTYTRPDPVMDNQRSWYMGETLPRRWYNDWDPGLPVDLDPY